MKKLMIAAFAVCVGLTVTAGQCTWGVFGGANVDAAGEAFEGGTALLYVLTGESAAPTFSEGTWNMNGAILAATSAYNTDDMGWGLSDWGNVDAVNPGTTYGDAQQYFAIVVTQKAGVTDLSTYTGDDAYYAMIGTQQGVQKALTASEPIVYGTLVDNFFDTSIAKGDWQVAQAVPEPTSGLLLLLGVAGLALRRRRA